MRWGLVAAAAAALSGCGVPSDPVEQAEEVHSVAAEGALVAHDAAEGETTVRFTRAHVRMLGEVLDELRPAIRDEELARLADEVSQDLDDLVANASDTATAARLERELEAAADEAERLAG